jgi:hypothetical protein
MQMNKIIPMSADNLHDISEQFIADTAFSEPHTLEHFGRRILFYGERQQLIGDCYVIPLSDNNCNLTVNTSDESFENEQFMNQFKDYILRITGINQETNIGKSENNLLETVNDKTQSDHRTVRQKLMDSACQAWAAREEESKDYTREMWLGDYCEEHGFYKGYVTDSQFGKALPKAAKRGLIKLINNRYRLVTKLGTKLGT